MIKKFQHWFAAPVVDGDDEEKHRISLLNAIMNAAILLVLFIFIGNLFNPSTPLRNYLIDLLAFAVLLTARRELYKGKIYPVGISTLVLGFLLVVATIASEGTVRSPAVSSLLLVIIVAGILFGVKGILISTAACSLAVLALVLAQNAGILPAPDDSGNLLHWFVLTITFAVMGGLTYFTHHVTMQAFKNAKKEIRERQYAETEMKKLLRAVEQSPASIVITDLDGKIEYANPRFCQVTGYSLPEVLGENPRVLKTDQTPPETHIQLWKTITAGQEWKGEFVNRRKDGSVYYESAVISCITNPQGEVTHYLAVKEDITDRKRIENELRMSDMRFRTLFEQTHDAVFILDLQGHHLETNQRAAEMLGYTIEEIKTLSLRETSAEVDQSQNIRERLLTGEEIPVYERRFRKKDGQIFPVEIHVQLVRDLNGNPLHILSMVRDISKRRMVEDALRAANQELHQRVLEVEKLQEELREQALHDPLTGAYNRRYLNETLPREIVRAERENTCLSIIIADIDHFKTINDTYGHQVGDLFLVEIAQLLKRYMRGSDIVCRYGGEEFMLVLPGATVDSAEKRAEEIRQKCMQLVIRHEGNVLSISMSFGIAAYPAHGKQGEGIILKADHALYEAKRMGRNQVRVWNPPLERSP